jgi:hypothetical protein
MTRDSATIGVEQNSPIFTPFTPNCILRGDRQIAEATSWQPAAAAKPQFAVDLAGAGGGMVCIRAEQRSKSSTRRFAITSDGRSALL